MIIGYSKQKKNENKQSKVLCMYKIMLVLKRISFMTVYQMASCVPGTALE